MNPQAIAKLLETSRHYFNTPLPAAADHPAATAQHRALRNAPRQGGARPGRRTRAYVGGAETWR